MNRERKRERKKVRDAERDKSFGMLSLPHIVVPMLTECLT
jgi:hypothetical protein